MSLWLDYVTANENAHNSPSSDWTIAMKMRGPCCDIAKGFPAWRRSSIRSLIVEFIKLMHSIEGTVLELSDRYG
jgi:hypothetical protein